MPDPRFFESLGPIALADLVALTGASVGEGADVSGEIDEVAPLDRAGPRSLAFVSDRKFLPGLAASRARAVFIAPKLADAAPQDRLLLLTPAPQEAYAIAAARLHRPRRHPAGAPAVHPEAMLEDEVEIGPGAVIGPGAEIGRGAVIGAGAVIGPGVAIGRGSEIGPLATVAFALLGDRVRILAGAHIGEPGFGAAGGRAGVVDLPQLGRVILQDGVTVGAGTCIDRGAWDDTVVGENTKIDNLVQIAHNVRIGRNCVIAAHTGISGSTVVGDGVAFGGRAGIADHVHIGDGAQVAAAAGVMRDIPAGERWGGAPAKPVKQWFRETAWLTKQAERKGGDKGQGGPE